MDAAYTNLHSPYPAFINARVEGDEIVVRVRSEGAATSSEVRMLKDEWHQWLANAQRVAK